MGRLRIAWQTGVFVPLASTVTVQELVRVLAYPKFRLDSAAQNELVVDYLPWVTVVDVPEPPPRVPDCRDRHDLPFLFLSAAGKARVFVIGDADLLALAEGASPTMRFDILTPARFMQRVGLLST